MFKNIFLSTLCLFLISVQADEASQAPKNDQIPAVIIESSVQSFSHEKKNYLAINLNHAPEWHTYWANPGDAGLPTKFIFKINNKEFTWPIYEYPAPERFFDAIGQLAFGFSGQTTYFLEVTNEIEKKIHQQKVEINLQWLACKHVCVPGERKIDGSFEKHIWTGAATEPAQVALDEKTLLEEFIKLPTLGKLEASEKVELVKDPEGEGLVLYYHFPQVIAAPILVKQNLITPYLTTPLAYKHEELFTDNKKHLWGRMKVDWDGAYQEPVMELPKDGKFKKPLQLSFLRTNPSTQKVEKISLEIKEFIIDPALSMAETLKTLTPFKIESLSTPKTVAKDDDKTPDIWYYIAMGFIGGFILNLMPCVFPIITLKLFELLQQREDSPGRIVRHNLFYSFGILSSFLVLASIILALKKGGESIGWGFHLQSPLFVSAMVIIIFTMTLNLFGMFELRTPGGSILGSVKLRESFFGDFFGGVIATILSTPCSAPFLGTALTFAFAASSVQTIIVFLSTGIGLASPFLITALFPELIRMLPRPGHWMNLIKKIMGLSLALTIAWLVDIFLNQTNLHAVQILGGILFTIFVCVFVRKSVLHRNKRTLIIFLIPLGIYIWMGQEIKKITPVTSHTILKAKQKEGLNWEMWSETRVQELQAQGETVFIDFTAKWCFTCKVNEKLVLDTPEFKQLVADKKLKLLLADWTNRDEVIGNFLKKQNLIGIPAYFIARPNGELIFLGETLTLDKIRTKLNQ